MDGGWRVEGLSAIQCGFFLHCCPFSPMDHVNLYKGVRYIPLKVETGVGYRTARSRSPVVGVPDVAGCAVCASAAPSSWRIAELAYPTHPNTLTRSDGPFRRDSFWPQAPPNRFATASICPPPPRSPKSQYPASGARYREERWHLPGGGGLPSQWRPVRGGRANQASARPRRSMLVGWRLADVWQQVLVCRWVGAFSRLLRAVLCCFRCIYLFSALFTFWVGGGGGFPRDWYTTCLCSFSPYTAQKSKFLELISFVS